MLLTFNRVTEFVAADCRKVQQIKYYIHYCNRKLCNLHYGEGSSVKSHKERNIFVWKILGKMLKKCLKCLKGMLVESESTSKLLIDNADSCSHIFSADWNEPLMVPSENYKIFSFTSPRIKNIVVFPARSRLSVKSISSYLLKSFAIGVFFVEIWVIKQTTSCIMINLIINFSSVLICPYVFFSWLIQKKFNFH